jgi:hypothetical protein
LAWKARPTHRPAIAALRQRPVWMAVTVASAASTSNRIIRLSGMLPRSSVTAAGLAASTTAAPSAATGPAKRTTQW